MIKELIVVEGKDDISAVKSAVDADIICTHGFGISEETIGIIKAASITRGVIVFTDPDFAGDKIRSYIHRRVPNCKDAYLPRHLGKRDGNIGIENASPEAIRTALSKVQTAVNVAENYNTGDMNALGLSGSGSKDRRRYVGEKLGIGYCNSKQFLNRLNGYGINKAKLIKTIDEYNRSIK